MSETASNPTPSDPDRLAARAYQGEAGRAYHEGKRGVPAPALAWIHALRAAKFQTHVAPTDTVFEFGPGAGWNLAALRCARRVGCDAADFLAPTLLALGIEFVADAAAFPDASADVVLCHHALEHVLHPATTLSDLRRILKPGGLLLVHVPWEREARYARYRPDDPNHHLHGWNAQTLGNLATVLGWRIESLAVRRYGYDRFAATLAHRFRLGPNGFRLLRALLLAVRPLREVELVARK